MAHPAGGVSSLTGPMHHHGGASAWDFIGTFTLTIVIDPEQYGGIGIQIPYERMSSVIFRGDNPSGRPPQSFIGVNGMYQIRRRRNRGRGIRIMTQSSTI